MIFFKHTKAELKPVSKRHLMVSGTLAPLYIRCPKKSVGVRYCVPDIVGLYCSSGPDRGRSPIELGDFPYVHSSIHPSVHLFAHPSSQPGLQASEPASQASKPAIQASEPASQASQAWLALKIQII